MSVWDLIGNKNGLSCSASKSLVNTNRLVQESVLLFEIESTIIRSDIDTIPSKLFLSPHPSSSTKHVSFVFFIRDTNSEVIWATEHIFTYNDTEAAWTKLEQHSQKRICEPFIGRVSIIK